MREPVDVVLCDLAMPKLDGDKLLRMKDASPGGPHIPFVFLTASADADRRARLLCDGAVGRRSRSPSIPPSWWRACSCT